MIVRQGDVSQYVVACRVALNNDRDTDRDESHAQTVKLTHRHFSFATHSMRDVLYYLTVLLLGGGLVWGLRSGSAGFVWWERRFMHRDREPFAYWVLMTIGFVVFIYFVINGRHMPLR